MIRAGTRGVLFVLCLLASCIAAAPRLPWRPDLSADHKAALERISAKSLRGNLSFLASDLLEGRATPSRGLDLAAEYIAAQFRRAGLEPAGDEGYFQTTTVPVRDSDKPAKVRNVIGVLPGSGPILKDTYVLVTAHYDHLGIRRPTADSDPNADTIYNGANDDGSGTVSVIELAGALAEMKSRPKRTVVFMTFFGEERGGLGSRYYGAHPIFPIEKTVALINLEQVGRTDDLEGARVSAASMTGFDYSDVGPIFAEAGKVTGVTVSKHPRNSDSFFGRSDNQSLADLGVPAHTLCTAYIYPDYHRVGDHWDKVDYDNMAKVDRMVALGLLMIADTPQVPHWNESNSKAARYLEAWKAHHSGK